MRSTRRVLTAAAVVTGLLPATPTQAATPLPITESFTKATYEPGWVEGGTAKLTASLGLDQAGDGWLRLTPAQTGTFGYVFNDHAFPSTEGVLAEFDYAVHGGTGADGIVFFLYDGATTAAQFAAGPPGGSVGYSHCPDWGLPGLNNAYVGVGFDTWGNFSLGSFCGQGGLPGLSLLPHRVAVRAGEAAPQPYALLASEPTTQPLVATRAEARHVTVAIAGGKLSTYVRYPDGEIQTVAKDVVLPAGVPPTLKLGFVAGTGSHTNNHEIRNTKVVKPVDLVTTVTDGRAGAPRGTHTWTAVVRNTSTNAAPGASIKATSPSALTGVSWTCTSSAGTCGAPSGTGLPSTTAGLPAGAGATYEIRAKAAGAPDDLELTVAAQPTGATGELAPLDNVARDATVLAPVNDARPTLRWDGTRATATSDGTWRGGSRVLARRWQACDADGSPCEDAGAAGPSWTPTAALTGRTLRLHVTASNVGGKAVAASAPVALPGTDVTAGPAALVRERTAQVAFDHTGRSAQCRLDDGAWKTCASPWQGDVEDGEHVLAVRARDGVLADASPAEHRWAVDAGPPAAPVLHPQPGAPATSGEGRVLAWDTEAGTTSRCRVDGGPWQPCSSPWTVLAAPGEHVLEVEAVDAAGNVSERVRTGWRVEPAACTSRRRVRVHWSVPRRARATAFRVLVDGRTVARLGRRARAHTVDLRGRGTGEVRVQVVGTGRGGRRLGTLRVYRTCAAVPKASKLPTIRLTRKG